MECFRCGRSDKEVRLFDAIYENEISKICERCSIIEHIPVIKKPTASQLRESERNYTVSQRLRRMSGLEKEGGKKSFLDEIKNLEENPQLELPEKKPFNLIDNFHWHLQRARRSKGLSQKQLAWMIGESEAAIRMIEKAEIPEDAEKLIRKLEQFLQIRLKEGQIEEKNKIVSGVVEKEIPILDSEVPEPIPIDEGKSYEEEIYSIAFGKGVDLKESGQPSRVLDFKPDSLNRLTISDLQEIRESSEREDFLHEVEEKRKKSMAEKFVDDSEKNRREMIRKDVIKEMKKIALGREKSESIKEKREMLNDALKKSSMSEEEKNSLTKEKVPTIYELIQKKQERRKEEQQEEEKKMTGDEIEIIKE